MGQGLPQAALRPWRMTCLLCGEETDSLTGIQEHAMDEHDVSPSDLRRQTRTQLSSDHYRWQLPDGRWWLAARR